MGYSDSSIVVSNWLQPNDPPIRTKMHGDEVWDVTSCGDMIVSCGRDRRVAGRTRKGAVLFKRDDAGWVVRVKASPNRIFLMGFDGVLHALEREVSER